MHHIHAARALALLACIALHSIAAAADWPMWRADSHRSSATAGDLPAELHLQWTRRLPPPQPAWPNEPRLHFDASYEPIVMGGRMFVGSMVDGSMTAVDCESGKELWRFYANGPIRLAPIGFGEKVCFGSDDGWLYCLDAATGEQIWKASGAPRDRQQRLHLGNARLVSFWPVRGGPVHSAGVVYFGAGVWPTLGVFIHAVDAETGELIWTNGTSHAIESVRIDHNYLHEAGLSPQGHLLVSGDMLIVPNGRSMPARLDRKTGKLHYFVQGYRNGDSRVVVDGEIALVGRTGVVNLKDGREIANRWVDAGKDAPNGWSSAKVDLFEGPLFPYKLIPGCDHRSVIARGVAYGVDDGTVFAYDLKNSQTALTEAEFNGKKIKPAHWRAPLLWKLPTTATGKKAATTALIKAGDRLYAHSGKLLFAVELNPENTASAGAVAWTKQLTATPTSMLAAADRLFVCTDDGAIQCFGAAAVKPRRYASRESDTRSPPDAWTSLATTIRTVSGDDGYAIVAGLDEGRLVAELLLQSRFNVIAIDQDVAKIDALRRRFGADERFLSRFQAVVADPTTIALPPYIANLIVSESVDVLQLDADSNLEKLYRHLRPYGGLLCLPLDEQRGRAVEKLVAAEQLAEAETKVLANLTTIERRGPLPGSAVWTHETADAARSFYSQDELVQAPLAILWYGDGRDHGFFKRKDYGHGLKPQVAGGRLFALQVATNTLKSVDAYTGRLLWSKKLGGSARYASMPNAVYVADNRQCLVLDPATGEVVNTFGVTVGRPDKVPVSASDIRVGEKTIVIAVRFNKENAISKGRWNSEFLVALDRKTGRQLWSRPAQLRYNTAAIAVANGRVFCIDSHSPAEIALMRRRGDAVDKLPSTILALEAGSGRELWKVVRKDPPAKLSSLHFMGVRTQDDWLAYAADKDLLIAGKADATFAFDAKSGEEVWDKPRRGQQPLILGPETFINQTGHTYDVANGDLVSGTALFRRSGCNYAVGGKNLLFLRANCATYVDVATRQEFAIRSVRSGCSNSLVAADGLLNAPCFSVGCVCNYPLQTSFAMFHLPAAGEWHE